MILQKKLLTMSLNTQCEDWIFGPVKTNPNERIDIFNATKGPAIASRTEAIDRMTQKMLGGIENKDSGFLLQISRSNAKRSLISKKIDSPLSNIIVNHVDELAKNSIRIESHGDVIHESEHVQGIHIFALPVNIDNEVYRVQLLVRDYIDRGGERSAIHTIDGISIEKDIEKTALAGTANFSHPDAPKVRRTDSTGETAFICNSTNNKTNVKGSITLGEFLKSYTRADGENYFSPICKAEFLSDGVYQSNVRNKVVSKGLRSIFIKKLKLIAEQKQIHLNNQEITKKENQFIETLQLYRLKGYQFGISEKSVKQITWAMNEIARQRKSFDQTQRNQSELER